VSIQSPLLSSVPRLVHGFGSLPEPFPAELRPLWERAQPRWRQVHGKAIAEVQAAGQQCGEVDALFTFKRDVPVGVVTADCVPLLLARADGGACAAAHAGWKGTRAGIARALCDELQASGEDLSRWVAAIGPSIGPCCFEVAESLAEEFAREFPEVPRDQLIPRFRHLDLPALNEAQLRACGVARVEILRHCTRCSKDAAGAPLFHSFRREGGKTRQWAAAACLSA
jgi:polyphenol oxidase